MSFREAFRAVSGLSFKGSRKPRETQGGPPRSRALGPATIKLGPMNFVLRPEYFGNSRGWISVS